VFWECPPISRTRQALFYGFTIQIQRKASKSLSKNLLHLRATFDIFAWWIKSYGQSFFYKDYFSEFFVKQREKVKEKIIWTFDLIEEIQKVPETYLKHI